MNLTAYSDSESESEAPPAPKPTSHRIVDRSNPGRIKLNLPGASQPQASRDSIAHEAPPAKKPRLGGGGAGSGMFSSFNAMLPAPKKAIVKTTPASDQTPGKRPLGKGLGAGINLKTGAEPAFKREPRLELDGYDESGNPIKKEPLNKQDFRAMLNLPPPKTDTKTPLPTETPVESLQQEPLHAPKPAVPRFVPLSVGRGKKKPKPMISRPPVTPVENAKDSTASTKAVPPPVIEAKPVPKPKVSLFGMSEEAPAAHQAPLDNTYQPLLFGTEDTSMTDEASEPQSSHQATQYVPDPDPAPNELTNIASELNLSEAERRQLFGKKGRGGPDWSSASIVEFNTDTEYAHNEKLRQLGEQVQHNPLKSFTGAGKNSLRSLVSQATTQKDALEDQFSANYRNKKEAGNKYGW